jgi:hypothetical protein
MNQDEKLDLILGRLEAIAAYQSGELDLVFGRLDAIATHQNELAKQQERTRGLAIELIELCQHIISIHATQDNIGKDAKRIQSQVATLKNQVTPPAITFSEVNKNSDAIDPGLEPIGDSSAISDLESCLSITMPSVNMLTFRPPSPLPMPTTRQLTPPELIACEWFYHWREKATGQKNVTTRKDLLWHLYRITEGRASNKYHPVLAESLGHRVKRLILAIG